MNISNLVSALIVVSLLIGNVVCACDKVESGISPDSHHQHNTQQQPSHEHHGSNHAQQATCDHQNCDTCTSLESSCTSEFKVLVDQERETRLHPNQKSFELDSSDLDYALLDTGQPRASPGGVVLLEPYESPLFLVAETPITRKDQLSE